MGGGGNDARFLFWVFVRAAPEVLLRIALHFWPATLIILACLGVLTWAVL